MGARYTSEGAFEPESVILTDCRGFIGSNLMRRVVRKRSGAASPCSTSSATRAPRGCREVRKHLGGAAVGPDSYENAKKYEVSRDVIAPTPSSLGSILLAGQLPGK